jgi:hypothetical protein
MGRAASGTPEAVRSCPPRTCRLGCRPSTTPSEPAPGSFLSLRRSVSLQAQIRARAARRVLPVDALPFGVLYVDSLPQDRAQCYAS